MPNCKKCFMSVSCLRNRLISPTYTQSTLGQMPHAEMHEWGLCWTWFFLIHNNWNTPAGQKVRKSKVSTKLWFCRCKSNWGWYIIKRSLILSFIQKVFHEWLNYSWVVLPFGSATQSIDSAKVTNDPCNPKSSFYFSTNWDAGSRLHILPNKLKLYRKHIFLI